MSKKRGYLILFGKSYKKFSARNNKTIYKVESMKEIIINMKESDPETKKVRSNNTDFSHVATYGKILRDAIKPVMVADSLVVSRLVKLIHRIVSNDTTNIAGQRCITKGPIERLNGFQFNIAANFKTIVRSHFTGLIRRELGQIILEIEPMISKNSIHAPESATHFQIFSAGCEIDFVNSSFVTDFKETSISPLDRTLGAKINLLHTIPVNSLLPLFLIAGIRFYNDNYGSKYLLRQSSYNPLQIIEVSCPPL